MKKGRKGKKQVEALYEELAAEVKKARKRAGLSQAALAEKVKVNRTTITNFERGRQRISLHRLELIAQVLGLVLRLRLTRPKA